MTKSSAEKMREWRHNNPEKDRASRERAAPKMKAYREKHKTKAVATSRAWKLKQLGITPEGYELLLQAQEGRCAICRQPERILGRRLAVDHDHVTGRVRGLLCALCNKGIGHFRDSPALLAKAVEYLLTIQADATTASVPRDNLP